MIAKVLPVVLTLSVVCALTGCSSSSMPNTETATITPASADLLTGGSVQFATNISTNSSDLVWSVNSVVGGNSSVGTIDATGLYTAPASQPQSPVTVTVSMVNQSATSADAQVTVVNTGQVASTANAQVAQYTIAPPVAAKIAIEFGIDTTYGLTTSNQDAPGGGTALPILVAGMKANTLYHMRAVLQMPDGSQLLDNDHTFTTGAHPTVPTITVSNPSGFTPQPGVELLDLVGTGTPVVITDLEGNVLWTYLPKGSSADIVQPIKLLPNGHFVLVIAPTSSAPLSPNPLPSGTLDVAREIDLAGNTIQEISVDTLNSRLAAAGFNYTAQIIHHDIGVLPNGHWILLVNSLQSFTNLNGLPGTTNVLGDALIDLDTNLNPVWMWNSFDHLDVNRHPFAFPDWTHSNAVLYSPTDGNLLLSVRHQSWIVKIDYADGRGSGDVLWRLGEQGDFTLQGATDPTDWFYAQHGPSFSTDTTAGSFGLAVFDNGNTRVFPAGQTCATSGVPSCPYSTAQVLNIDETSKTAAFNFHQTASSYSNFGGNAGVLDNQNVEYDLCSVPGTGPSAAIYEVMPTSTPQTVWQMTIANANAYRGFRMPSMYPGVQW